MLYISKSAYRYEGSGFVVAGREYSVTFTNYLSSRSLTIIWQETQDLNVIIVFSPKSSDAFSKNMHSDKPVNQRLGALRN